MRFQYQEIPLREVMDYFINNYGLPDGVAPANDWFYDPVRGRLILKWLVENEVEFDSLAARPDRRK